MAGEFGHQNASLTGEQIKYGAASFFVEHVSGLLLAEFSRATAGATRFLFRISFYIVWFRLSTRKTCCSERFADLRVQPDGRHNPGDRTRRARLVGLESAGSGSKQPEQLAKHDIQHRTILVRKAGTTVQ